MRAVAKNDKYLTPGSWKVVKFRYQVQIRQLKKQKRDYNGNAVYLDNGGSLLASAFLSYFSIE